ncbi:MAG TPA: S-adenosylmethionine decarboxylase [Candidatus Dormibacteraeota bacterium]|nr:S-adenosylmethionine decarboxylase [Candidatus Dormibacteraeota bacterium]
MLFTLDGRPGNRELLTDPDRLGTACRNAVDSGGGHVLDEARAVFPNGAVTLVLVLAESHLSLHTWPEDGLVAIDLFSCGSIDGARVLDELARSLELDHTVSHRLQRGMEDPDVG